jgi:putative phosphoribosyl transferase
MTLPYRDRRDAGRQLAAKLIEYANRPEVKVLGLPRGGIPVAAEVAEALGAPLDAFLVRKLGVPGHEGWPWAPSPREAFGSSMRRWCALWQYRRR